MHKTTMANDTLKNEEPDIEDCIVKDELMCQMQPGNMHDFSSEELEHIRHALLTWYHKHRRRLPWRGDHAPYTSAGDLVKSKSQKATIERFFKKASFATSEKNLNSDGCTNCGIKVSDKVSPYETWVSEIMLQQTRVDSVINYFVKWIQKFPTIEILAEASEEEVNSMWAGLGYYRRARMLHAGAKSVQENFGGKLPSDIKALLTIPGIGRYTAGAIASIAFGKNEPVVDGNVIRVFSRLRAIRADPKNKRLIDHSWKLSQDLIQGTSSPGCLNQALMELGATLCGTQNALCGKCPVQAYCLAFSSRHNNHACDNSPLDACEICDLERSDEWKKGKIDVMQFPLKVRKTSVRNEILCVVVISSGEGILKDCEHDEDDLQVHRLSASESCYGLRNSRFRFLMRKRPDNVLLANQWEFLNFKIGEGSEIPSYEIRRRIANQNLKELLDCEASAPTRQCLGVLTHIFSHVRHNMGIEHIHFNDKPGADRRADTRWLSIAELQSLGMTTGVKKILQLLSRRITKVEQPGVSGSRKRIRMTNCRRDKHSFFAQTFVYLDPADDSTAVSYFSVTIIANCIVQRTPGICNTFSLCPEKSFAWHTLLRQTKLVPVRSKHPFIAESNIWRRTNPSKI